MDSNSGTTPYSSTFFDKISDEGVSSARVIVPLLMNLVNPASVVDIGCGTGAWLSVFLQHGVTKVTGLDGDWVSEDTLLIPKHTFQRVNLTKRWAVLDRYDLALCLEVGEHLPHSAAIHLVSELITASDLVLFSAALPGQEGTDHINEQWPEYWEKLFAHFRYCRLDPIRRRIWQNPSVAWYYQQNLYLFVNEDILDKRVDLAHERELVDNCVLTLVHPKIIRQANSVKASVRHCGTLIKAAIRRRLRREGARS